MSLIQKLVVETDTHEQLVWAVKIAAAWHRTVSHYMTGVDVRGVPYLSLLWAAHNKDAKPLIAPLEDAEAIALQIESWLKTVDYGRQPDHDGSNNKGWKLVGAEGPQIYSGEHSYARRCEWDFYSVVTVQPAWIEYHK